jgi:hypothetical protein
MITKPKNAKQLESGDAIFISRTSLSLGDFHPNVASESEFSRTVPKASKWRACCPEEEEEKATHRRIERALSKEVQVFRNERRCLLLGKWPLPVPSYPFTCAAPFGFANGTNVNDKGTGDSGKSTIIKQMRIRHGGLGTDLLRYKKTIHLNLLQGLSFCITFIRQQNLSLQNSDIEVNVLVFYI